MSGPTKVKKHSPVEKLHLRRLKRKQGPSAQRRRERRLALQSKEEKVS